MVASSIASAVASCTDETRVALRSELTATRDSLARMLVEMASSVGEPDVVPELRIDFLAMPTPILPNELRLFTFDGKRWPGGIRAKRVSSRLVDTAGNAIVRMLSDFGIALRAWARGALARLGEQFAAQADPLRARAHGAGPAHGDETSVLQDLRALGAEPPEGGP
jgi:hypothetical protein